MFPFKHREKPRADIKVDSSNVSKVEVLYRDERYSSIAHEIAPATNTVLFKDRDNLYRVELVMPGQGLIQHINNYRESTGNNAPTLHLLLFSKDDGPILMEDVFLSEWHGIGKRRLDFIGHLQLASIELLRSKSIFTASQINDIEIEASELQDPDFERFRQLMEDS